MKRLLIVVAVLITTACTAYGQNDQINPGNIQTGEELFILTHAELQKLVFVDQYAQSLTDGIKMIKSKKSAQKNMKNKLDWTQALYDSCQNRYKSRQWDNKQQMLNARDELRRVSNTLNKLIELERMLKK